MNIIIKKFGDVLSSRQSGREAYLAFAPVLRELKNNEQIIIDFDGIISFSPSWGDEFITPIYKHYGDRIKFINRNNPSVTLTLSTLEKANGFEFRKN